MCMCEQPNINGEHGYSWNGEPAHVRRVDPPELEEDDQLLYDEPGRCGGLDSHCHHVRVVKQFGRPFLLVRNGGGTHRLKLPRSFELAGVLDSLDSNSRYWLLLSYYHTHREAARTAAEAVDSKWRKAAAEKRIKTRKRRGKNLVKVWIESAAN